jgi:hypothetical protein
MKFSSGQPFFRKLIMGKKNRKKKKVEERKMHSEQLNQQEGPICFH